MSATISQEQLKEIIAPHGFELFGALPVSEAQTMPAFEAWLDEGMNGTMDWIARPDAVERRAQPEQIVPGARSVITLAYQYTPPEIPAELLNDPSRGIIARYALYRDYHKVIKKKLITLGRELSAALNIDSENTISKNSTNGRSKPAEWKAYVDTGPFLEREWASRAGLGFIGRNSNLIHYTLGSYLFLSEIITTAELPRVERLQPGSCGSCTNCVDKCPTGAIVADRKIDARKCISYLTIEHRGAIPVPFRSLMRNRIYGCDICQEVCPWNRKPQPQEKADFQVNADLVAPPLETLLIFNEDAYLERFAGSPIRRATREGFMRNVSIALGNWGASTHPQAREAQLLLEDIRRQDTSELVQEHVAWALQQCR